MKKKVRCVYCEEENKKESIWMEEVQAGIWECKKCGTIFRKHLKDKKKRL